VIIFTAILALVSWLVIDMMTDRPFSPMRTQRTQQQMSTDRPVPGAWVFDSAGAESDPGLSRAGERWNR
jgi:hypothetical protein